MFMARPNTKGASAIRVMEISFRFLPCRDVCGEKVMDRDCHIAFHSRHLTNRWTGFCSNRQSMRPLTRCALLHYDYSIRWLTGDFSPCRQIQSWNLLPQRRYNDRTSSPVPGVNAMKTFLSIFALTLAFVFTSPAFRGPA